jgi:polysaccharide deacetylase 2 family uncharacterized protein YibQ
MYSDDLNRPLGLPPAPATRPGRSLSMRGAMTAIACVFGAGAALYIWANDDGHGGRPRVVVDVEPASKPQPAQAALVADPQPTGTIIANVSGGSESRRTGEEIERASGVRVVRQEDGEIPGALIIRVPDSPTIGLTPAPDKALVEKGPHGPLPRIGSDGRKPLDVYARPVATSSKLPPNAPRVAIMVGGMGLSQNATRHALDKLPPAVTLAFAPYGNGLAGQVAGAREKGHEIILQAPMEPFELAGEGPGPHLLRTSHDKTELKNHLHWLMSRYPGYVGIANFLGAKFLADARSVAAVVEETASRGLLLLDDGSSPQSLTAKIAAAASAPHLVADVIIDADRNVAGLEKALLRLESMAREKGLAVGVATGLPETVDRIANFTSGLEKRGIALVPISAAAGRMVRPTARIRVSP